MSKVKWGLYAFFDTLIALIMIAGGFAGDLFARIPDEVSVPDTPGFRIVEEMKLGWNLGNTLEAFPENVSGLETETGWGNPRTTREMIGAVKAKGFNTVRVPVTWHSHMGPAPDYVIDAAWMDRVQEVADYAYDLDMYVVLNMHHDDRYWFVPNPEHEEETSRQFAKLWEQIAERFRDYGERLLFESANEPRVVGSILEWAGGTPDARKTVNRLNELFVDTVRASGGNNSGRWLLIPTYAASCDTVALNALVMPDDGRAIASVHAYYPRKFTSDAFMDYTQWTQKDRESLEKKLAAIYRTFVKKGVPVYLGEFGAVFKDNDPEREKFAADFVVLARKYGMTCAWWDNGILTHGTGDSFALLDRNTLAWEHEDVVDALVRAAG